MGQRGTKPVENLGHRITDLPGLPEEPPREICSDDYACEAWERFVPALNMLGHVCILNLPDVLTVCQAYSLARTAWEDLAEDGRLVVEGESSSYENPLFRVWVTANARMEKCLKNLGMTPGALQSLKPFGGAPRREAAATESSLTDFL